MNIVEISNAALAEVGQTRINTLLDQSEGARLCNVHVKPAIREVLEQGRWKAARTQVELTQNATAPLFGWDYAYNLPVDYVRMVAFNEVDSYERVQENYEIHGRILMTDFSTVSLVYIRDLTNAVNDVNVMGPLLTRVCILNLAAKICFPLQQSGTLKKDLEEGFERALRRAKAAAAQESFEPVLNPASGSRWIASRL